MKGDLNVDLAAAADALRTAGARFALVHGSRAVTIPGARVPEPGLAPRPDSDLDVGAWWGAEAPDAWRVTVPVGVDLVVLDAAPLWLAGRIAQYGQLLFDDDPAARVAWQADTRLRYVDELPGIRQRYRERRERLARG
jgi:uncharacterized protein